MTKSSAIEDILRHDRPLVLACLIPIVGLAAAYTLLGIGMGASGLEMTTMPGMTPPAWTPGYALVVFLMWWMMMIAMMLPNAAPTVLIYAAIKRRRTDIGNPLHLTAAFLSGYLILWGLFSLLATALQWSLELASLMSPAMSITSGLLAGLTLVMAGIYQFTPVKRACLIHCQHPVRFLTTRQTPGLFGAWRLGARHGLFCVGCCAFLMSLLFVGGIMNLYWIVSLALYVLLEKLLPYGRRMGYVAGAGLIVGGAAQVVFAVLRS
jgi:predicted metal-binding membrane protein